MAIGLLSLGSNIGDRAAALRRALERLADDPAVKVCAVSPSIETRPAGGPSEQGPFLNAAALVETALDPHALLQRLQQIERELGRATAERWAARTIDLDLLLYEDRVLDTPALRLPHPRMAWRRFVLAPAAAIAPQWRHPTIGWTIAELLRHLDHTPAYVAIAGPIAAGKSLLAQTLERRCGVRRLAERLDADRLTEFYRDTASHAWATEMAFLSQRAAMLARDKGPGSPGWSDRGQYTVSDFWYNQSLCFARVWLDAAALAEFEQSFQSQRQAVVRPRLVVLLDAPADELLQRIRRRGRPYEQALTAETLERLRQSILAEAAQPHVGPLMRLDQTSIETAVEEVAAAMESMQP